jgi:glycosyltransferase involved in cell wall biosynthesis
MVRVGFLALHQPASSPSQRYRLEAFIPYLEQEGIVVDYAWVLDRRDLGAFYGKTSVLAKATVTGRALLRRVLSLLRARSWDVVFVQREAFFLLGPWAEQLASLAAPIVFDFDDAIWLHAVSPSNQRFAFLKNVDKIAKIAALAHTTIAGNEYLAAWARGHSSNVQVVPTCVDTDLYKPAVERRDEDGAVTIGWSGSPSTVVHFQSAVPMLRRVKERLGDRVRIRVMGDPSYSEPSLGVVGEAWTPAAELVFLQETDIGIMPLPDDEWTRGKCGLKALTAMASGAPTVVSPVGVNVEIVQHEQGGLLARTPEEWEAALGRLVEDPALRRRLGEAARQTVVDRYSVQRWAPELARILTTAAAAKRQVGA